MSAHERLPMYTSASVNRHRLLSRSSSSEPSSPRALSRSPEIPPPRLPYRQQMSHRLFKLPRYALPAAICLILLGLYLYEPHVELSFYDRTWIHREIDPVAPLGGCFNNVSPHYNISQYIYGPKRTEVQAGIPLRMGLDCYNFASTVQRDTSTPPSAYIPPAERTQFHTYWRVDLTPFGQRQEWMLRSFFATQDLDTSRLILWSNGDLSHNPIIRHYLNRFPDSFTIKVVNIRSLARGTSLEKSEMLNIKDEKAWVDGDLIRLLLLWNYGGVWIDMDSLLTRDLEPLLEHEFVTQWDCYGMPP